MEEDKRDRTRAWEGEADVRLRLQAAEELATETLAELEVLKALKAITYQHLLAHRPDLVQRIGEAYAASIALAKENEEKWRSKGSSPTAASYAVPHLALTKSEFRKWAEGKRRTPHSPSVVLSGRGLEQGLAADLLEMRGSAVRWPWPCFEEAVNGDLREADDELGPDPAGGAGD